MSPTEAGSRVRWTLDLVPNLSPAKLHSLEQWCHFSESPFRQLKGGGIKNPGITWRLAMHACRMLMPVHLHCRKEVSKNLLLKTSIPRSQPNRPRDEASFYVFQTNFFFSKNLWPGDTACFSFFLFFPTLVPCNLNLFSIDKNLGASPAGYTSMKNTKLQQQKKDVLASQSLGSIPLSTRDQVGHKQVCS